MSERSDARVPLSVLVPVKNEAANLRDCLASVSFAEEIVVVDSASTDGTTAIAEAAGARVVQFVWNGKFPRKKNWALENIPWQNEWILIVDADERLTPELEREIRKAIRRTDVDGFYLNRRFWFLGGWINHCGYFPSWNLRLFRHRLGRYEQIEIGDSLLSGDNEVHEHVLLNGRAEYLAAPMEHYAFPDIATFVEKHNRYSTWEAAASGMLHERAGEKTLRATPFGDRCRAQALAKETRDAGAIPSELAIPLPLRLETGFSRWLPRVGAVPDARLVRAHDPSERTRVKKPATTHAGKLLK